MVSLNFLGHGGRAEVKDLEAALLRSEDNVAITRHEEAAEAIATGNGSNAGLEKEEFLKPWDLYYRALRKKRKSIKAFCVINKFFRKLRRKLMNKIYPFP